MLVLTRKLNEKILIGENIAVTVVGIDRGRIRLGVSAPNTVKVNRAELVHANEPRGTGPTVGEKIRTKAKGKGR